jgi:ABC-type antimicrobial peptide transport system ATPase subunit
MRYAYVLGDSPTIFMGMKSTSQTARMLKSVDQQKEVALLCINDDLGNENQKPFNDMLRGWFQHRWPGKLGCEL